LRNPSENTSVNTSGKNCFRLSILPVFELAIFFRLNFACFARLVNNKNLYNENLVMVKVKERIVDIEDILSRLEPDKKETVENLRGLIKNVVPQTVETVKHGKITYKLGNVDFVWISSYRSHVNLEFFMGASLDSNLLKSGGKQKSEGIRHITVSDFGKSKPEITRLLKDAATLGSKHCPTTA
jgi:hypothetical protein